MEMTVLGSSSKGNGYVFRSRGGGVLLLELGVPATEVKRLLGWRTDGIVGALVSHRHGDHAGYISQYLGMGVTVLALADVFEGCGVRGGAFCRAAEPLRGYRLGGYKVFTLDVDHDVPCLGFIISHEEMGSVLFVTDTMMLRYELPAVDHIMLEANYSDECLGRNIGSGRVSPSVRPRLMRSHMELGTACGILRRGDTRRAQEVILLHLSDGNSDEEVFRREAEKACGKPVYVAKPGLSVELNRGI